MHGPLPGTVHCLEFTAAPIIPSTNAGIVRANCPPAQTCEAHPLPVTETARASDKEVWGALCALVGGAFDRPPGRSGPQSAQFFAMFCGADSSPPDVSTAVARAFEEKAAGLAEFRAIEGLITIYLDPLPMHLGQRLRAMIGFVPSRTGIDFLPS